MTIEEELKYLREEKKVLREQLVQRDELIEQQQEMAWEQNAVIQQLREQLRRLSEQTAQVQQMREQISGLSEQVTSLREQLSKDSHHSHLPPSSDRFGRKPKSLRKKSEKPSGGQPGHQGSSLQFSCTPDEIIEQQVERCEACQHDLPAVAACGRERRKARGPALASSAGARISGRAETLSPLSAYHQCCLSRRGTGPHPIWTHRWSDGGLSGPTATLATGPRRYR